MPSSDPTDRLGLGTAQFGGDYGITNRAGKVSEEEAARILAFAAEAGIATIDTARLYAESESIIGRAAPAGATFSIVTKTRKFGGAANFGAASAGLQSDFADSLAALKRSAVQGLLLHDAGDLTGPMGDELWSALEELKRSGQVSKIGVSVYEPEEVDQILDRYPIDIIQLPFNALDQRLVSGGQLQHLAKAGVEIHARSIFLQGLLLASVDEIPAEFRPLRPAIEKLDTTFSGIGVNRLEGLLAVILSRSEIDRFVVGVTSVVELQAIVAAARRASVVDVALPAIDPIDPVFLNPSRWSELS